MAIANDMVVSIEYEVRVAKSSDLIDSNKGGKPFEFLMGHNQVIPGLEEEIAKMSKGEHKVLYVPADKAYGAYNVSAVEVYKKEQFAGIDLKEGMTLYAQSDGEEIVQVTVKEITNSHVIIDYNHPLAGKDLEFDLTVIDVREATKEEKQTGIVKSSCCATGHSSCCGH